MISNHQRNNVAVLTVGSFATGLIAETKRSAIAQQYKLHFETMQKVTIRALRVNLKAALIRPYESIAITIELRAQAG
jgi:hypothetical protein